MNQGSEFLPSHDIVAKIHPALAQWFTVRYGTPAPAQLAAWAALLAGKHTLVAAPTGSGKTLAALVPFLHHLLVQKAGFETTPEILRTLYITPLKALNNDILTHLHEHLAELSALAQASGLPVATLRAAVRTGDTSSSERSSMLRHPPDVLITTPESLFILLTSQKGRTLLQTVEHVIIDEIHDLAASQRGVHLSLSLERLNRLCKRDVVRVGLSATVRPTDRIAQFLGGFANGAPRPVTVIEHASTVAFAVSVYVPDRTLAPLGQRSASVEYTVWQPLIEHIMEWLRDAQTAIIYVNNRRLCERLTLRLNESAGTSMARAHHGSIARAMRLESEQLLKAGKLRCIVATSSLELGIDVGSVDLVLQIDSPLTAASGIQRIGRANHFKGGVSRGVIIAKNRSELPEMAVLAAQIRTRISDPITVARGGLPILCQHILSHCSVASVPLADLYELLSGSDAYHVAPAHLLVDALELLSGYYPFLRPHIHWDRVSNLITGLKSAQFTALLGAGAIPQTGQYPVHHVKTRAYVGELDEEYVYESRIGDVFQLGAASWMIQAIERDRVYVSASVNRFSEIPFWRSPGPGRTVQLGIRIGAFLRELADRLVDFSADKWLAEEFGLRPRARSTLCATIARQSELASLPTDRTIVVEKFLDENQQTHVLIHSLLGRRLNQTWLTLLLPRLESAAAVRLHGYAHNNGLHIVLPRWQDAWLSLMWELRSEQVIAELLLALPGAGQFAATFRQQAETALLLSRSFTRTPTWLRRLRAEELFRQALPFGDRFPLFREAQLECLEQHFDPLGLESLLRGLELGEWSLHLTQGSLPTPFARQFLEDFIADKLYESDALAQDLQMELQSINRHVASEWLQLPGAVAQIAPAVLEQARVARTTRPHLSSQEEVVRHLKEWGDLGAHELSTPGLDAATAWLGDLEQQGRIARVRLANEERFIVADELTLYEEVTTHHTLPPLILMRYCETHLPVSGAQLATRYNCPRADVELALAQLAEQSLLEPYDRSAQTWISTRLATQLIRQSVQAARTTSEQTSSERVLLQTLEMQHILPTALRVGVPGLRAVIEQLQGLYLPLGYWEDIIFPTRMKPYRKEYLDLLCAAGDVLWLGRRSHEGKEEVAFFLRSATALYEPIVRAALQTECAHPELLAHFSRQGALFYAELANLSGLRSAELLPALYELIWQGRVANDQFAPLRHYFAKKSQQHPPLSAATGRFYALQMHAPHGNITSSPETSSVLCWLETLLQRSPLLAKGIEQQTPYPWETLQVALRALEEVGKVTRGHLASGVSTLQYATRQAAAALRQPAETQQWQGTVVLAAVDPANPFGSTLPWPSADGPQFARKLGNFLILQDGRWRLWVENGGKRIYEMTSIVTDEGSPPCSDPSSILRPALESLVRLCGARKLVIEAWNGQPVADSPIAATLTEWGAMRKQSAFTLWPIGWT